MKTATPEKNQPVYWFVLLDTAIARGEYEAAARAVRELRRLGVRVQYPRLRRRQRQGGHHAD